MRTPFGSQEAVQRPSNMRAVVFDLYGTLVGEATAHKAAPTLAAMAACVHAQTDEFATMWNRETIILRGLGVFPSEEANIAFVCRALGLMPSASDVRRAADAWMDYQQRLLAPLPGTVEALEVLRASGYALGLISNCGAAVPLLWPTTPLASLFDTAIFSCAVGVRKPFERIYRLACEQLGVQPEDCLYVGDGSANELEGAARVGMTPVLIAYPAPNISAGVVPPSTDVWAGATVDAIGNLLSLVQAKA